METISSCVKILTRTKSSTTESVNLKPTLSTFSLTFLGLGLTIGTGLFVITGHTARMFAGPSVVLSFMLAAVISFPSALCYAEFGCRFRQAGSAYIYTYTSTGEIYAFIVGWNMFLEYIVGASAQGRAIVEYMDVVLNGTLEHFNEDLFGDINYGGLMHSFNAVGLLITLVMTLVLLTGSRGTARSNEVLTSIKIGAALFIITVGSFYINADNWSNFMPFGIQGVIKGTAGCFFAFVGFDAIATGSEEAKDPKYSIPIAIFMCLLLACALYIGVSAVLTLMVPYYELYPKAPLIHAFGQVGLPWAKYIILFSGVAAMLAVLITSIFAASRTVYSMACDGLVFKTFAIVSEKKVIPVRSIIISGLITALVTFFLDLTAIIEMMSVGTLVSYLFVAISVLLVRFNPKRPSDAVEVETISRPKSLSSCFFWSKKRGDYDEQESQKNEMESLMQQNRKFVYISITLMIITMTIVLSILNFASSSLVNGSPGVVAAFVMSLLALLGTIAPLFYFPRHHIKFDFTVPLVPLLPIISIAMDLFLILNLHWLTWIRTVGWLFVGLMIYFFYGVRNSIREEAMRTNSKIDVVEVKAAKKNSDEHEKDLRIIEKGKRPDEIAE